MGDLRDVWTYDDEHVEPVLKRCRAEAWPPDGFRRTVEGDVMFVNTHFATRAEAWEALLRNTAAGLSLRSKRYEEAKAALRRAQERLADWAVRVHRVGLNAQIEAEHELAKESDHAG